MDSPELRDVIVTDVRIRFMSLVILLVKVALAAIPAVLIVSLLAYVMLKGLGILGNLNTPDYRHASVTDESGFGAGFTSAIDDARVTKAQQDIRSIETALTMYRLDNSKYPTTDQGLRALIQQPTDPSIQHWRPGGYVRKRYIDPWGNEYQYVYPSTHGGEYDLYSLGADGQPGGDGVNAEIGNWEIEAN